MTVPPHPSRLWALLFFVAALGCDARTSFVEQPPAATRPKAPPPPVTAEISNIKTSWRDGQQTFSLKLRNQGDRPATVHAIVYACNEEIQPPRRNISPPTAYEWFALVGSRDGTLAPRDIEKNWRIQFQSARGGKRPKSWEVNLMANEVQDVEAAHDLNQACPHPAWKDQPLNPVGFTDYHIWLFTVEGDCFFQKDVLQVSPAQPLSPEDEAGNALRLAYHFLDSQKKAQGREQLQLIVNQFPETTSARIARKLLRQMNSPMN